MAKAAKNAMESQMEEDVALVERVGGKELANELFFELRGIVAQAKLAEILKDRGQLKAVREITHAICLLHAMRGRSSARQCLAQCRDVRNVFSAGQVVFLRMSFLADEC
jgi:hypothetical protein